MAAKGAGDERAANNINVRDVTIALHIIHLQHPLPPVGDDGIRGGIAHETHAAAAVVGHGRCGQWGKGCQG